MKRLVNGEPVELPVSDLTIEERDGLCYFSTSEGRQQALVIRDGDATLVSYRGQQYRIERIRATRGAGGGDQTGDVVAPMPGQIVDVRVAAGDTVTKGQVLLVLEAMKMQQPLIAKRDGTVRVVHVAIGAQVADGQRLLEWEA